MNGKTNEYMEMVMTGCHVLDDKTLANPRA
jgi:hypothetical protein